MPLVEVRRQVGEVGGVDQAVVVEIALVPAGNRLVEVRRQDGEVGGVDQAVKIGVTQQRVLHFDLAGRQAGDLAVLAVGIADAVQQAVGFGSCRRRNDPGAVPTAAVIAAPDVAGDS